MSNDIPRPIDPYMQKIHDLEDKVKRLKRRVARLDKDNKHLKELNAYLDKVNFSLTEKFVNKAIDNIKEEYLFPNEKDTPGGGTVGIYNGDGSI